MTKTWILIFILTSHGGGVSFGPTFTSKHKCNLFQLDLLENKLGYLKYDTECREIEL